MLKGEKTRLPLWLRRFCVQTESKAGVPGGQGCQVCPVDLWVHNTVLLDWAILAETGVAGWLHPARPKSKAHAASMTRYLFINPSRIKQKALNGLTSVEDRFRCPNSWYSWLPSTGPLRRFPALPQKRRGAAE